jgi:hypothetical protein
MEKLEKIINESLREAAFIGYDEDDEMSQMMFDELVKNTVEKIRKIM